jgi:8-oxo-dGTP pyrophosphatase MutT (NUDIX family)
LGSDEFAEAPQAHRARRADCGLTVANVTRGRACAIIRHDGRILLNRYGGDSFWALPGGAAEAGEFSPDALVREMREELGVSVGIGRLIWVIENLFAYRGTDYTEYGFYYEVAWPPGNGVSESEFAGLESDQFFRWATPAEVAALDFRPSGLKPPLLALMSGDESPAPRHFTFSGK